MGKLLLEYIFVQGYNSVTHFLAGPGFKPYYRGRRFLCEDTAALGVPWRNTEEGQWPMMGR